MKNGIVVFIIGFVLGAGSVWVFWENRSFEGLQYLEGESNQDSFLSGDNKIPLRNAIPTNNRIVIPNQESGGVITIQFVSFTEPGWVVVHELLPDRSLGNALGAQRFDAGEYSGGVSLLRVAESGNSYAAVLYTDNGDRRFDIGIDLPELNDSLEPIQTIFSIL